jgi:peptidoglycan pentaglycine glycine transferase (the first glycine)
MMDFIELSKADKGVYNRFVSGCETGSFLQSWEWGEWQEKLGRKAWRFVLKEGDKIIAAIQLIRMPLFFGKYYLYAPYGPVSDLNQKNESFECLQQAIKKKFLDALFIRIEPKGFSLIFNPQLLKKTANIQPSKTLLVDLTKSEQLLLEEMHPKTRYNIKVAQKHGVDIKDEFSVSVGHGLFFEETLRLIIETSTRQKFNTFPSDYYKEMVDFFAFYKDSDTRLHIYKAVYDNQLLNVGIFIDFGFVRTFLFGGSSVLNKNVMAPYLMHYQAMLDAKKMGYKIYDFWGLETSGGQLPGFVRFKIGFAPLEESEKSYAGAYDIIQKQNWYRLYTAARKIRKLL